MQSPLALLSGLAQRISVSAQLESSPKKSSRVLGSPLLTCSRQNVSTLIQVLVQGRNWVLLWGLQGLAHSEHTANRCLEEKGIEPPWIAHTTTTVPPSPELPPSWLLCCQATAFPRVYYQETKETRPLMAGSWLGLRVLALQPWGPLSK